MNAAALLVLLFLLHTPSLAQERPTLLVGHGTLSGSILPLWVGAEAKLFDKHGVQVKPIYLPRAAGRPALLAGEIQIYFSAGPPLVQMRLSGGDIAIASCAAHKLTSKIMVAPAIHKVADLRGKVFAVANPGSASDFAAKLYFARQGFKLGQDVSLIYSGSTSAAFSQAALGTLPTLYRDPVSGRTVGSTPRNRKRSAITPDGLRDRSSNRCTWMRLRSKRS